MIELTGNYELAAPPEMVWETFLNPEVLARIVPGCEALEQVGDHEYKGKIKLKIGPVQGVFQGKVTLSDLEPPSACHVELNGRGAAGIINGHGDVKLEAIPAGTNLQYEGEGNVQGRMATVGQRLMTSSANSITRQSLQNLEKQVAARMQPEPGVAADGGDTAVAAPSPQTAPAAAPPAPSQTEFMTGVAKDLIEEFVPNPQHRQLISGIGALLLLVGLANWFANLVARRVVAQLASERREH